jgi:type II restriction enzyme
MTNPKEKVLKIIKKIEKGGVNPIKGWNKIRKLKDEYVANLTKYYPKIKSAESSWHAFIGSKFEKTATSIIRQYVKEIKRTDKIFNGLTLLSENEVNKHEVIKRKLTIDYGEYFLLPDIDLSLVDFNPESPWNSTILAIISCKTSLRERIAQSCYWKLKLLASKVTKNIKVFLASVDNDNDFLIDISKKDRVAGKTRNRIIAEYELDGVYIFRDDFKKEWESDKIKRYENILNDFVKMFKK